MAPESPDITRLLHEWAAGSREAENELFTQVMPDLRRLARHLMRGERKGHSLQATELVNQIYGRLVAVPGQHWQNRRHFFAIAARAMRRYLIDHARGRPGVRFTALGIDDLLPGPGRQLDLAVTIDNLLDQLNAIEPEWCHIVEIKYFLGLTDEEAADALGIKLRTLQRGWRDARQWLFERLEPIVVRPLTQ
ncbi:MAG: ECF-type sigma factor [Bryobacteraceae bacterium]